MARAPKMMRKRRFDDGGIVEKTFSEDESVKSRFGEDMLDKARAYTALAREPMPEARASAKSPVRVAAKPAAKSSARAADDSSSAGVTRMTRADRPVAAQADNEERPPRPGTLEDPEYRKKLEKSQALESVHPEMMVPGGGALKMLHGVARSLARGPSAGPALNTLKELPGPAARKALPAPGDGARAAASSGPKLLPGEGARKALPAPDPTKAREQASSIMGAAGKRAAADRERKQELSEMRGRSQDAAKSKSAAADDAVAKRRAPRNADESRMSGEGGGNFRKGGSVRGCGIARKGFTKGTMR